MDTTNIQISEELKELIKRVEGAIKELEDVGDNQAKKYKDTNELLESIIRIMKKYSIKEYNLYIRESYVWVEVYFPGFDTNEVLYGIVKSEVLRRHKYKDYIDNYELLTVYIVIPVE